MEDSRAVGSGRGEECEGLWQEVSMAACSPLMYLTLRFTPPKVYGEADQPEFNDAKILAKLKQSCLSAKLPVCKTQNCLM